MPVQSSLALEPRLRLMRDGIINNLGFFISSAMGIVLVPIMLTGLGPELYGLWIAALATVSIAGLFEPGLGWPVMREVAATRRHENRDETIRFVSAAGNAFLSIGLLGAVVLGLLGLSLATELHLGPEAQRLAPAVFALAGLAFLANQASAFTLLVLTGLRRFDVVNTVAVVESFLRVSGVFLLLHMGFGLLPVVAWWVAATGTGAVVGQLFISRLDPPLRFRPARLEWSSLRRHMPYGLSSKIVMMAGSLGWLATPLLISLVRGSAAVVPYHIGQKFPLAILRISGRASDVFFPAASEVASAEDSAVLTREILALGLRWSVLLSLPLCLVLGIIAPGLLRAWIGEAQTEPLQILYLLAAAVFVAGLGDVPLHVVWARQAIGRAVGVVGVTGLTALGLIVWLLVRMGPAGAAWGVLLYMIVSSICFLFLSARECGARVPDLLWTAFQGLLIPGMACAAAAFLVMLLVPAGSWLGVIGAAAAAGTAYAFTLYHSGAREEERALARASFHLVATVVRSGNRLARWLFRRVRFIRSSYHLMFALVDVLRDSSTHALGITHAEFERQPDPWNYAGPQERSRHRQALAMLDQARNGLRFEKTLEIGCAEGHFTELLADRCVSLLAVDFSPLALDRARARCAQKESVRFDHHDLRSDAIPDSFDLVVAMDVLSYFCRPSRLRAACRKIIAAVPPAGYLLVGDVRQRDLFETAWWGKRLLRGGRQITNFLAAQPDLQVVATASDDTHVLILLQKRKQA